MNKTLKTLLKLTTPANIIKTCKISPQTFDNWLQGRNDPNVKNAKKLKAMLKKAEKADVTRKVAVAESYKKASASYSTAEALARIQERADKVKDIVSVKKSWWVRLLEWLR